MERVKLMNRRDILKTTLLAPFIGLFGGKNKKLNYETDKIDNKELISYIFDSRVNCWEYSNNVTLTLKFRTVIKYSSLYGKRKELIMITIEEYIAKLTKNNIEKIIDGGNGLRRYNIIKAINNSTTDKSLIHSGFNLKTLNINGVKFKLFSISYKSRE